MGRMIAAGDFEIRRPGALGPEQGGEGCPLGGLAGPVHRRFRRVASGRGTGVHRLGPGHQDDAEVATGDGTAGVVEQGLGCIAADGGQDELGRHGVGVEAEFGRHQEGGVDRPPGQRHHDPDAVGPTDQGVPGRSRAARCGARRVLCGGPQGPRHQFDRFGPLGRVGAGIGRDRDLADPDDDRCVGMERHAPGIVPADAPGSPGPLGRLGAPCASPSARTTPGFPAVEAPTALPLCRGEGRRRGDRIAELARRDRELVHNSEGTP